MHICLYTETALPKTGGQEMVVDALARQFQQLGHRVTVLAPYPKGKYGLVLKDKEFPYTVARHPRFLSTWLFVGWYRWWLHRLSKQSPIDILHCHSAYPTGYLATLTKPSLGVPVVITSHGGDVREGNIRLAKPVISKRVVQTLHQADWLIAISRFTEEGYLRLGASPSQIVSIPNGVELETFSRPIPRPDGLDSGIRPGEYVLFLGRLRPQKGVDLLLDALGHVPPGDRVQLVVAGPGEQLAALRKQADQLRIASRVCFLGPAFGPLKTYLLQNALCTVMPSRGAEAFPLVSLESFAAGTPVLGSRIPGLEDVVVPGKTGWLVPPESPQMLGQVLESIFRQPEQARALGNCARQVAQSYSWRNIAEQHLRLFDELLHRKTSDLPVLARSA
jgi:teichuronic acid biosynthesis glycosyltransferase TuaC